jgi:hypothetical protein
MTTPIAARTAMNRSRASFTRMMKSNHHHALPPTRQSRRRAKAPFVVRPHGRVVVGTFVGNSVV